MKHATFIATRQQMFDAMMNGQPVQIQDANKAIHTGMVNGIEREDGSGYRFLVRLHTSTNRIYVDFSK